jgi:glycosidase
MEFHISRTARDRYQFDESLFSLHGNVIFANFHAARAFAQKINQKRDLARFPEQAIKAGQLNALGLIDEILHFVAGEYRRQKNPQAMAQALAWLDERIGREAVDAALRRFADEFPALAVYRRQVAVDAYLAGETGGVPNRQIVLEEMLMLWLANVNPATAPFMELFDDAALEKETAYLRVMAGLREFFTAQPAFGPDNQNLIDMLRSPAIAVPHSLSGQLEYMLTRWSLLLGSRFLYRLLRSLDLIQEEEKPIFAGFEQARPAVVEFGGLEGEAERFTPDKDWMPRLVLIAKNTYVWLDQLSKKHKRSIGRLDEIPDEELDLLAGWGFTGLWLIGLWERSAASKRIKQIMGNPDAVASAYSLHGYGIASDLGGDAALHNLKERAWRRGIRLASDMVPNHVGIDSEWVMNHPDWFVSLDYSPFPSYSFNGPDLSNDGRVGIFIEDHYYARSDAAVVFKRVDRWTGGEQYIYHGNDGTSLPWNDTAQLNYLKPEVREAVIQTILHVARQFSIIRFDAAMTLAKKHYQRLWFPEPGTGGAIASRAEHGLTRQQFDAAMPIEFWREVVDRAAVEAPDTLLLAEAFWLMEGYFVRTLGMHRVYNSAFMNMLRDEDNAKYRSVIKNTLEFDPEILKRYVNFMNNPDERTAVDQFGKGDKYFGICTLLATLPGLPMFGHGQVEGFAEKYGMEFRRAYWDEQPDGYLVERHARQVFPLLHRRYLFAEVRDFLLYDFYTPGGHVDENVFAHSNRAGDQRGLVVYHNKFASTRGWIRVSAAYAVKSGGERTLAQRSLGEGLGLRADGDHFTLFRDHVTDLEYIRSNRELFDQGLYVELDAYQCHVFLDFREVRDNEWRQYANLSAYLGGRGVPSIDEALRELFLQPVHQPFKELVNPGMLRWIVDVETDHGAKLDETEQKVLRLLRAVKQVAGGSGDETAVAQEIMRELDFVIQLDLMAGQARRRMARAAGSLPAVPAPESDLNAAYDYVMAGWQANAVGWGVALGWLFVRSLGRMVDDAGADQRSRAWIDEWLLGRILAATLQDFGLDEPAAWRATSAIRILTAHQRWFVAGETSAHQALSAWLMDEEVRRFLQVNRYQDVLWFNQESFEHLLWWMMLAGVLPSQLGRSKDEADQAMRECYVIVKALQQAEAQSGYQVEKLLEAARDTPGMV